MSPMLLVSLVAVFVCVALVSGLLASKALSRVSPGVRRLRGFEPGGAGATGVLDAPVQLTETPDPRLSRLSKLLPTSARELRRLRPRLVAAGYSGVDPAVYFSIAKTAMPIAIGVAPLFLLGVTEGWLLGALGAVIGYFLPDLVLARMVRKRCKAIDNGLPDALDLMIVCIEAGSSLDQSIVKASDELELAHPALTHELRLITAETRAGKPRAEAFHNFAKRTTVEDIRSLVTMLVQTDRFGTSVAKALRTHADTSRIKRRQRAEERAAKVGVKLVFPLVLCVFPAVCLVCVGPAVITIYRAFF